MQSDFELLEIVSTAGIKEIKNAYRQKAKLFHPDRNPAPDAAEKFRLYTEAYERLIDLKEGRTFVFSTTSSYENEIREKARQQSLKKYKEWQQHLMAYERLSIHKLFWGKKASTIMIIFCLLIVVDDKLPGSLTTEIIQQSEILQIDQDYYINIKTNKRELEGHSRQHDQSLNEGMPIVIHETPIFHYIKSYSLINGTTNYPNNSTHEYLPAVLIILLLLTGSFLYTFKNYQSRLWIKTMTIISILYYLLSIFNAQR